MQSLYKYIFTLFLFVGLNLAGAEDLHIAYTKHLLQHVLSLPHCCQPDLFLAREQGTVTRDLPALEVNNSSVGDSHKIEAVFDEHKRLSKLSLINTTRNYVESSVVVSWKGDFLSQVRFYDSQDKLARAHYFSFDDSKRVVTSILEGNLSGTDQGEQYKTECTFDEEGRVIKEWEQNGKTIQYVYPKNKTDFFVVITSDDTNHFRNALRSSEKGCFEEIVDDGISSDINNLNNVSARKFRTTEISEKSTVVTVGAVDLASHKKVILRKTEELHSAQKVCVHDGHNKVVSYQKPNDDEYLLVNSKKIDEQFINGFEKPGRIQHSSLDATRPINHIAPSQEPVSVSYTARGQPCRITFTDGSTERIVYSLDGFEVEHCFPDGTQKRCVNDSFGRVLEEGNGLKTIYYSYDSLECSGIEVAQKKWKYTRDIFGRVTDLECSNGTYHISYDALDRIVGVIGQLENPWSWEKSFSLDGQETRLSFHNASDKSPYVVTEKFRPDGSLALRREDTEKETFCYEYDDQGRIFSVDHDHDGQHEALKKIYTSCEELEKVITTFADQTSLVEEVWAGGKKNRAWLDAKGAELLAEEFEPLDAKGSTRVTQRAACRSRTIEWEFGPHHHLSCVKVGERATEYSYDGQGRLITKKTPLHTLHYYWEGPKLKMLQSEDGSINYQFTYDAQGRMVELLDTNTSKQVVRSFDSQGRLESDGEQGKLSRLSYENEKLSLLRLPDDSSIAYTQSEKGCCVQRGGWKAERGGKQDSSTSAGFRPVKVTQEDRLGEWEEEYSYDALNQLCGEKGEFTESYSFSPFGTIASKDGIEAQYNIDGDPITFGEACLSYDAEGNVKTQELHGQKKEFFYDALGRVSKVSCGGIEERYRYDALSRLQEITIFQEGVCKDQKELVWIGECEIGAMQEGVLTELRIPDCYLKVTVGIELKDKIFDVDSDDRGSITALLQEGELCQVYRYSAFGALHAYNSSGEDADPISPWLYSGKRLLKTSELYDFGHRRYDPFSMRWCEKDPLGMVDGCDDRVFARNNPAFFLDVEGLFAFPISWSGLKQGLNQTFHKISSSIWKSVTLTKNRLDWFWEMRDEFEEFAFQLIGQKWAQLIGYNPDSSKELNSGKEEKNNKVRVTFINGILNWSEDTARSAALISELHGGMLVHYIYSATQGFTSDVVRGIMAQSGFSTPQSSLLASMWKRLIAEMGGVEGGGVIYHYAHSLGATDTYNALLLLTPEERNLIHVATFGGSTMICEGLCGKSDNYVSTKDGIPILDFAHYISSSFGKMSNVHFLASDSSFLFDHPFQGKTYRTVLELLGHQFQEQYLLSASH